MSAADTGQVVVRERACTNGTNKPGWRGEQRARRPWKQMLWLTEVNLPWWKPAGLSLKTLPLQPVYAMTIDLKKKTLRASLDKVAARLTEGLR